MASTPFWTGKNCTVIFLLGSKKVELTDKSVSVEEDADDINDDVNGEDRTRDQKIVNGYNISIDAFQEDTKLLETLIADTQQKDTRTQPNDVSIGLLIKPNNGTRKGFQARECTIKAWKLDISGRRDRAMVTVPVRARYFETVPTV